MSAVILISINIPVGMYCCCNYWYDYCYDSCYCFCHCLFATTVAIVMMVGATVFLLSIVSIVVLLVLLLLSLLFLLLLSFS